jgi:hypothetical protein
MAVGAVVARILTQYSDKGSKAAQKDLVKLGKKFDDFGKKAAKSFGLAITATAALSVKIGTEAVQAAIDDAKSQAILANALRATGNASGELTAASEAYIEATMFRVNVADEQLRASLAQLILSTGDLSKAERLQTIALDVAAASGRDLAATTIAITRANEGNVQALKRLSPELSGLIKQGMAAEEVFLLLEAAYGGTAESLADLDPLTKLRLQYGEVLETLGTELLPVVKEFAAIIETDVLPAVEAWISANGGELREGIKQLVEFGLSLIKTLGDLAKFYNKYDWVIKLAFSMFALGRAAKMVSKVVGPIAAIFRGLSKGTTTVSEAFKKLYVMIFSKSAKEPEVFAGVAGVLSRVAKAIGSIAGGFVLIGTAGITASNTLKELFNIDNWPWEKDVAKIGKAVAKVTAPAKPGEGPFAKTIKEANDAAKKIKLLADARAKAAAQAAKDAAKEAADAAKQARIDASVLRLKKQLNITKDSALDKETDIIQLAAAEALLKKQGVIAEAEMNKLKMLKEENFLLSARDTLAKRYLDIQKVLADQKIDTKELEDLSKKWGISNAAVIAYIHLVKSVEDQAISTEEIKTLADLWNTSEYEAQKFLETYMRIQDGLLDSNEVFALIDRGFFESEKDARIYADIVATVHDGIANDEDFQRVADKWDITKEKVNEYLKAMGADFDYQGTFIDPVTLLETQWQKAAKALQDYLDKLNSGKGIDYSKLGPSGTPTTPGSRTDSAAAAAAAATAATSKIQEQINTLTELKKDAPAGTIAGFRIKEQIDELKFQLENGTEAAKTIVDEQTKRAGQIASAQAAAATVATFNAATFRRGEEASMASFAPTVSEMDYDERFRFRNSMTMDNSKGLMGSGGNNPSGNQTINVNVNGSIQTQEDIVEAIRQGLLAGQTNGKTLTLQAI